MNRNRTAITGVTANVSLELSVVAESDVAMGAAEAFRTLFLAAGGRVRRLGRCRMSIRNRVVVRKMTGVDRFESGQLVELSDFDGTHAQSGQLGRMKRFRTGRL